MVEAGVICEGRVATGRDGSSVAMVMNSVRKQQLFCFFFVEHQCECVRVKDLNCLFFYVTDIPHAFYVCVTISTHGYL